MGKLYRNGHFGTHFGPKNLRFSGLSWGFKSLLLPTIQSFYPGTFLENRSKSARVLAICERARTAGSDPALAQTSTVDTTMPGRFGDLRVAALSDVGAERDFRPQAALILRYREVRA